MKIVFITQNLAPFRIKWLDSLAEQKNAEIDVVYLGQYEKLVQTEYKNISQNRLKLKKSCIKFLGLYLYNYRDIFQIVKDADVVLVDGYGFFAQVILILFFRIKKQRFILSADGGIENNEEPIWKNKIKRIVISSATAYFSTCENMDRILSRYGAKSEEIYRHYFSSVESRDIVERSLTQEEKQLLRNKYNISGKYVIVSVGKDIKRKGFDVLLEAVRMIDDDVKCILIGAEEAEQFVVREFPDLIDRVKCIPYLEKAQLMEYYDLSDCFVLPTRYDIWGLVIGEAMARRIPVITTKECIAGVCMLDGIQIVEAENSNQLTEKIKQFIHDRNLGVKIIDRQIEIISQYAYDRAAKEDWNNLMDFMGGKT